MMHKKSPQLAMLSTRTRSRRTLVAVVLLSLLSLACVCTWFDPRTVLIDPENTDNAMIQYLRSCVPEDVLSTVDPEYYTDFGFRDWWRFPLVYPYSIEAVDTLDQGQLCVDGDCIWLTHLSLDCEHLLIRTVPSRPTDQEETALFGILSFDSGEITLFDSEDEMLARAEDLGFEGETELMTLLEYDALFWE